MNDNDEPDIAPWRKIGDVIPDCFEIPRWHDYHRRRQDVTPIEILRGAVRLRTSARKARRA